MLLALNMALSDCQRQELTEWLKRIRLLPNIDLTKKLQDRVRIMEALNNDKENMHP